MCSEKTDAFPCFPLWGCARRRVQASNRPTAFPAGEAREGNGFPRAKALGMTYIFCLVYLHGHCEEGQGPDAAIRIPRPLASL